jgi:hypothetical protein
MYMRLAPIMKEVPRKAELSLVTFSPLAGLPMMADQRASLRLSAGFG